MTTERRIIVALAIALAGTATLRTSTPPPPLPTEKAHAEAQAAPSVAPAAENERAGGGGVVEATSPKIASSGAPPATGVPSNTPASPLPKGDANHGQVQKAPQPRTDARPASSPTIRESRTVQPSLNVRPSLTKQLTAPTLRAVKVKVCTPNGCYYRTEWRPQ